MENVLLKLKRLLNSIDDEELKELELWIDNENTIDIIYKIKEGHHIYMSGF